MQIWFAILHLISLNKIFKKQQTDEMIKQIPNKTLEFIRGCSIQWDRMVIMATDLSLEVLEDVN